MSEEKRAVSIIIPTHNNARLLLECLQAVRKLNYPRERIEVVVVDNASDDGTTGVVREQFKEVKYIRLEENTGFAPACNRGAEEASGEYIAFLNNDAVPEEGWVEALFAGMDAGGTGAICAASQIRTKDGEGVEYDGASSNLFGVGRPYSAWGWPHAPQKPGQGSPVLFASGGAMLIHRRTFLEVGGFDPHFFAYFEDVDLGWRLWALGYKVVYAPNAIVRHIGGATGSRVPEHRRYTLWECNSLATVLKNYEGGTMERVLSAALLLLYKRAVLSAGEAIRAEEYNLTGPKDTNVHNIERLPKVSAAHLAAIDRFNRFLPHFMEERRKIQAARKRSDAEILPLLGNLWDPQLAGAEYAQAARGLAWSLQLFDLSGVPPKKVLIIASPDEQEQAEATTSLLTEYVSTALVVTGGTGEGRVELAHDFAKHMVSEDNPDLRQLMRQADAILVYPGAVDSEALKEAHAPVAVVGSEDVAALPGYVSILPEDKSGLINFCLRATPMHELIT